MSDQLEPKNAIDAELADAPETAVARPSKKAQRKARGKWSTPVEQFLLLSFICDAMPFSKDPAVIPLEEMCKALGWSTIKVLEVRSDLLEAELLDAVSLQDIRGSYGYRITEAGKRFLDGAN